MRRRARRGGFTLIEAMIVVCIVSVLALLAFAGYRRWVRSAYLTEAQDMISNIRTAEESFRAENGGYLSVSTGLGPPNDYPAATPGAFKTAWGSNPGVWANLAVQPSAPVLFGYSLLANNTAKPNIAVTVNGKPLDLTNMNFPWFFVEADGDEDGNGVFTHVYAMSATNQIFVDNEGE